MPKPNRHRFEPLSQKVIEACIDVQRQMGTHCTEDDYQRALALALPKFGVSFEREVVVPIEYEGAVVTHRRVDFGCRDDDDEILLEIKAAHALRPEDVEQSLLYLTQSKKHVMLLVNFGEKPIAIRRFVHSPGREKRFS